MFTVVGAILDGASIESLTAEDAIVGDNATIILKITTPAQLSVPPTVKIFDTVTNESVADISPVTKEASYSLSYLMTKQGNFRIEAKLQQPCQTCEKSAFFSVNQVQTTPVPETSLLAVAMAAFGALAVLAIKGRKEQGFA